MKLIIEGKLVDAQPDVSLLEMIKELALDDSCLSRRPLAAKIAGEVFTLNYVPLRQKDVDRTTMLCYNACCKKLMNQYLEVFK